MKPEIEIHLLIWEHTDRLFGQVGIKQVVQLPSLFIFEITIEAQKIDRISPSDVSKARNRDFNSIWFSGY